MLLTGCFSAPPQIISLEPTRNSTAVPADAAVRVVFDHAVLESSVAGRFRVSPAIAGCDLATVFREPSTAPCRIRWLDGGAAFELQHPGAVFAPSTYYVFTLAGGFSDRLGARNGLDHQWGITTAPPPRVTATTPADQSRTVAVDTPLAISFSAPMDVASTVAAITLEPGGRGTQVVRSDRDPRRFLVLPGAFLTAATSYTLRVEATARGQDGQSLGAPVRVRFLTVPVVERPHALVLAGLPGAGATQLLITDLAPAFSGDPVHTATLLQAPACAPSGCAQGTAGSPRDRYVGAALAPDGRHAAVVIDDDVAQSRRLEVLDTLSDAVVSTLSGGSLPSWSSDGQLLAFVVRGSVQVIEVASGSLATVAAPAAISDPPRWAGDETLVLNLGSGADSSIQLVDLPVDARYSLPGAPAQAVVRAVSPAGDELALTTADGGALVIPVRGGAGGARQVRPHLRPLGFAGEGTLVAIDTSGLVDQLARVSTFGADSTAIALSLGEPQLDSVRVDPDGRRLVFLTVDASGTSQAAVANADGSGELALTRFLAGGVEAQAVVFSD